MRRLILWTNIKASRAISIITSITKIEKRTRRGKPDERHFLWWIQVNDVHKRALNFGFRIPRLKNGKELIVRLFSKRQSHRTARSPESSATFRPKKTDLGSTGLFLFQPRFLFGHGTTPMPKPNCRIHVKPEVQGSSEMELAKAGDSRLLAVQFLRFWSTRTGSLMIQYN